MADTLIAPTPPTITDLADLPAVAQMTGLAERTVHLYIKRGTFPAPHRIGRRIVVFDVRAVGAWLDARERRRQARRAALSLVAE